MQRLSDRPVSITPPGTGIARFIQELVLQGDAFAAADSAQRKWPGMQAISKAFAFTAGIEKAPVDYASTTGATWASPLAQAGLVADFIPLLYAESILGRLSGFARRVPFQTPVPVVTASPAASWTAQGLAKPVQSGALDMFDGLQRRKVSSIMAFSRELARRGAVAEQVFRRSLIDSLRKAADVALLDVSNTGDTSMPASITSSAPIVISSGEDAASIGHDISKLADHITTELTAPFLVGNHRMGIGLAASTVSDATGRFVAGVPLLRSSGAPDGVLVLIDGSELIFADDGDISIDLATHASIQIDSAPSDSAASQTSLWQNGLVGLKAEYWVNWTLARSGACAILSGLFQSEY